MRFACRHPRPGALGGQAALSFVERALTGRNQVTNFATSFASDLLVKLMSACIPNGLAAFAPGLGNGHTAFAGKHSSSRHDVSFGSYREPALTREQPACQSGK